jgi:hypothetical protein
MLRLSLFIPLLAAWLILTKFQSIKDYGLLIGFPALLLILSKPVTKE